MGECWEPGLRGPFVVRVLASENRLWLYVFHTQMGIMRLSPFFPSPLVPRHHLHSPLSFCPGHFQATWLLKSLRAEFRLTIENKPFELFLC